MMELTWKKKTLIEQKSETTMDGKRRE